MTDGEDRSDELVALLDGRGDLELDGEPADPNLTDTARTALAFVRALPGTGWLSGQEENDDAVDEEQAYVETVTGSKPALRGFDMADYIVDPVDEAVRSFEEENQLITLSWHLGGPPKDDSDFEHCFADTSVEAVLTEGTEEHEVMFGKLERMADRLEPLADADVPVFWRPYHEMDGEWFWWSNDGPETYCDLWEWTYEYFVEERDLHNLVWVWSASHEFASGDWYPGADYVDVSGVDTYRSQKPNLDWGDHYDDVTGTAPGKPVALAECDIVPDPDDVADRHPFVWFLPWHTSLIRANDEDHLRAVYDHPYTVTAADLPEF
jgi:mannan endo-1,4-beta-mannosidase